MNLDINLSNKQLIVRKKVVSFIKNYAKFNNIAFEYEHLKAVLYNEKKFIKDEENNIVYEYEYDDYGDIITIKTSNNSIHTNKSLSYDSLNRLICYNGNDVIYSSINPWLIQYINGFNLTFDDNKLTRISKNNMDYSYIYDNKGFRLKKINNNTDETTEYFYEGNNLVLETCNNYKIYYYYDENNDLIGFKYNNQKYYYIRNAFKTIEKVIDNNGNIVISYRYDPYGKVIMTTKANNAPINHFLYKGYYYDDETGLAMVGQRYYSPELCRFIQPADVSSLNPHSINGLNLYAYANNNPTCKAKLLSFTNVGTLCGFTTNILIPSLNIPNITSKAGNDNYWNPHWKNKWFDTDWPGLFVVSNSAVELINWGLTIYKGSLYFDNDEQHSIYNASLNLSVYAGFNFEKNKYGVELGGSVGRLGYDGRFIDVQVDFLTAKFFFIYEDGKLKIDPGFGWVDFGISIDIAAIIEYLKGNG